MVTEAQVNAGLRHVLSFTGGGLGVLAALGMLEPDQVKNIIAGLQQTMDGLSQATAGLAKVLYIVGPLLGVTGAAYAAKSANFLNQLQSVLKKAQEPSEQGVAATKKLLDGVANIPEVDKVVASTLAAEIPNDKVVAK